MDKDGNKSFGFYMRSLHRDLGFFIVGLIIIVSLSGLVQIYRDTDFLKEEAQIERILRPGLTIDQVRESLRIKDFKVLRAEGDIVYFQNGTYNSASGHVKYTVKNVAYPFNKFIDFHKSSSKKLSHWFTTIFGVLLLFMAISAFCKLTRGSRVYKQGIVLVTAGILLALLFVFLQ